MNYFLTGTDTGVGKTYVACALVRQARLDGLDCVGLKPIVCGERHDAQALRAAADGVLPIEVVNPIWFATPAAPYLAAMLESRPVDLPSIRATVAKVRSEHASVIIEGVGGWAVPIARDYFVSDLAADCGLPVVVVVANRLGALNHTLLTIQAITHRGLPCAGVILNEPAATGTQSPLITGSNPILLESLLPVPILGELAFGERLIRWRHESPLTFAAPL